jgi:predicted RNA-binding protein with PUA-like domain
VDYLLKTEPSEYSFEDLLQDKTTWWDGVSNPQALKNIREMKPGDRLVIYHTADERRVVGTATVVSVQAEEKPPRLQIRAGRPVKKALTLAELKAHKAFAGSPLLKQGRLSVVPLTAAQYRTVSG